MLRDLLNRLRPDAERIRASRSGPDPVSAFEKSGVQPPSGGQECHPRHSHGLEQFLAQIRTEDSLCLLDVGGVTQANVAFLTNLGHKLYSEAFLPPELAAGDSAQGEPAAEAQRELIDSFLSQNLDFPAGWFDGVLLWDSLEFLPPPLLKGAVDRLYYVSKPGAYLLAFFHADEKAAAVPTYSYRIHDSSTLMLAHRQMRSPCQRFNNRSVEKLFQRFQSVKFFLARDHLREVIVRR